MKPALLQVLSFRLIFQIFLRKYRYNLPTTFLALSCLEPWIPDGVVENMFSMIKARHEKIKQTIQIISNDPNRLSELLLDIPSVAEHLFFLRRPMIFIRERQVCYVFADLIRSVSGDILPHFEFSNNKGLVVACNHTVQLSFESLVFEDDSYILNHREMRKITFYFPKNFDLPKCYPSLFTSLKLARESNVRPQPRFSDDHFHVKPVSRYNLFMSFTFSCPSCHNTIFDYNCLKQKNIIKTFEICNNDAANCNCICCKKEVYKQFNFP
jgi:hypothetical protein